MADKGVDKKGRGAADKQLLEKIAWLRGRIEESEAAEFERVRPAW